MNNTNKPQTILISDGTAIPSTGSALTTSVVSKGVVAVYGNDMTSLNTGGSDTISTKPGIYIVEGKTDVSGVSYVKRSSKITGNSVLSYKGERYKPSKREVWTIGYNRKTSTGLIEVNNDTNYHFTIRFKNDKNMYSERPEVLNINFQSAVAATQLTIATQAAGAITSSAYKGQITAIVVGDGTGVYGLTGASNYGVEIWSLDIDQMSATSYFQNRVYFATFVDDSSGFGATTTCTQILAFAYGTGTYEQVYNAENIAFGFEGVANRRLWPIAALDYSASNTYITSSAIVPTVSGTINEDKVTFSATVAAMLRDGENVTLGTVTYKIKYFISSTVAILTTPLVGTLSAAAVYVRYKYSLINIEINDVVNGPIGTMSTANKSIIIAVPCIDSGSAYSSTSAIATSLETILNAWMTTTSLAPANITL